MYTAFIVYLGSMLIMLVACRANINIRSIAIIISIVFFSLLMSIRSYVGVDFESYLYMYKEKQYYLGGNLEIYRIEYAYQFLIYVLNLITTSAVPFFFLCAFLPLYIFYRFFVDVFNEKYFCYFVLPFFSLLLPDSLNIMRQFMTFSIFIYSLRYISERKALTYIICILIGSLFHKSILICLPFYLILNQSFSVKKIYQIIILTSLFIISYVYELPIYNILTKIPFLLSYDSYLKSDIIVFNKGFGYILIFAVKLLLVLGFNNNRYNHNSYYRVLYNLFLLSFITYLLPTDLLIGRLLYYLTPSFLILAALHTYYAFSKIRLQTNSFNLENMYVIGINIALLAILISNIIKGASQISPFEFII